MYLRSYKPEDLAGMFALDEVCFDVPFRFSRRMMRRMASAKKAIAQLACEAGGTKASDLLLGFCIVHLERVKSGPFGYVVTLDVDPAARRRGVAAALMQATEQIAADAGARTMRLHVYAGNAAAIRLYGRLRYTLTGAAEDFYGPGLDALVYVKALGTEVNELETPSVAG